MVFNYRYTGSSDFGKIGYEDQFLDCLERVVRDLDKRIQRGKERLARSAEANKKVIDNDNYNDSMTDECCWCVGFY